MPTGLKASIVALACVMLAGPVLAQGGSEYERLDVKRLADALSSLGMTELLEALACDPALAGTTAGRLLRAETRVGQALSPGVSLDDRNRLLDQAIEILRQVVQAAPRPASDDEQLQHFRNQVKYAEVAFQLRVDPYIQRLRYLHGAETDRKIVTDLTAEAPRFVITLLDTISRMLEDCRRERTKLVTVVPHLEQVQDLAAYRVCWVRFYRALALDEATHKTEKEQLLYHVVGKANAFASDGEETGVKWPSVLLMGMALREMGQHGQAASFLRQLNRPQVGSAIRIEALFETARNWIEQGLHEAGEGKEGKEGKAQTGAESFAQAQKAIDEFRKVSYELLKHDDAGELRTDVSVALLRNYLYQAQSAAMSKAGQEAKARELAVKAEQALIEFLAGHEDIGLQEDFLYMVTTRYRDRQDYDNLGSAVLVGLGIREFSQGQDLAKADELLRKVLARKDEVSKAIRPLALWRLGLVMDRRGDNRSAGDLFLELAESSPDNPRAFDALVNAVKSYVVAVQDNPNLRGTLIKALEPLVEAKAWPARRKEAARWYFELGWQYQKMSQEYLAGQKSRQRDELVSRWMQKAIDAYQKVPQDGGGYLEALHLSLELQARLPEFAADTREEKIALYRRMDLADKLGAYAKRASEAAGKAKDAEAKALLAWAAAAEFRQAEVLYEMGERDQVWAKLEALPGRYPGTAVIIDAAEFHIRKLIEEGRENPAQLSKAIEKAEAFRRDRPEEAEHTIRLIVQQIRDRIRQARDDPQHKESLEAYQVAFGRFAKDLFTRVEDQPIQRRYALTQMYAESLLEKGAAEEKTAGFEQAKGDYEESLKLFTQCADHDDKARQSALKKVEDDLAEKLSALDRCQGSVTDVRRLADEYLKSVKDVYGLDVNTYPRAAAVAEAIAALQEASDEAGQRQFLELLVKYLQQGYEAMEAMDKAQVPVDANNIHGLARANWALRQHAEAARQYARMLRGLDRNRNPAAFWRTQLEYCRCVLEGFPESEAVLQQLLAHVRQLIVLDRQGREEQPDAPRMGGLLPVFRQISETLEAKLKVSSEASSQPQR